MLYYVKLLGENEKTIYLLVFIIKVVPRLCGCHKYALVAQLDRVSDSDVSGRFS